MKRSLLPVLVAAAVGSTVPAPVALADAVPPQVVLINGLKSCTSLQCPSASGLIKMGTEIWPHITLGLTAPDEMTRFWSLGVLSEVPMLKARDSVAGLLSDSKVRVRAAAAYALGAIKDRTVSPHLTKALKDKDLNVRFAAAVALARVKDPSTVTALTEATRDQDEDVRAYACLALGDIGSRGSVPVLMERLDQDAHPKVRGFAAMSLSKINDPRTLKLLKQRLAMETDAKALAAAIYALGELGDRSVLGQLQKLEATLKQHPNKAVRESRDVAEYTADAVDKLRATLFAKLKVSCALPEGYSATSETDARVSLSNRRGHTAIITVHAKPAKASALAGANGKPITLGGKVGVRRMSAQEVSPGAVPEAAVPTKVSYFFDTRRGVLELSFMTPRAGVDVTAFDRAARSLGLR